MTAPLTLSNAKAAVRKGEAIAEACVEKLFTRADLTPDEVADMLAFRVADVGTEQALPFIRRGLTRVFDKYEAALDAHVHRH